MALNSSQSVNEIKNILQSIQSETKAVVATIDTIQLGKKQVISTEEISINAAISDISNEY